MPFANPSTASGLDLDPGKYYVKVVKLEDADGSQYGPQMLWKFEVATLDGVVLEDDRGFKAEFWQWSSPKISTGGKRPSKAYEWGAALMPGVDIMELTGEEFATMVINKKAVALIGPNENGNVRILNLSPIQTKNGAKAQANGKPAAAKPEAPPEEPPDDPEKLEADAAAAEQSDADAAPW